MELTSLSETAAVDWSTRRWQWPRCSATDVSGDGGGGGSVDRDGGSGLDAVKMTSVATMAAVDQSTETLATTATVDRSTEAAAVVAL